MGQNGRLVAEYAGSGKLSERMSLIISGKTQVPETRSPPHDQSTAPALNRRKRCRCGILPDHKTALEHREDGEAGKRTAATALNRGKRCRCGGGRMVVWGRTENLPRSGLSRGSNSLTSRFMVCLFMSRGFIRRYMTVTVSQLQYVCVFHE